MEWKRGNGRGELAGVRPRNRRVRIHRDPDLGEGRLLPSGGPRGRAPDELRSRGRELGIGLPGTPLTGSNTNQFRGAIQAGFMFSIGRTTGSGRAARGGGPPANGFWGIGFV